MKQPGLFDYYLFFTIHLYYWLQNYTFNLIIQNKR